MTQRRPIVLILVVACSVAGLGCATLEEDAVTIYRDDWGVPHIFAPTEELGFYGLGYAQAEDQLVKLLGAVYWYQGRRAELEGEAHLALDIEQRRWRHAEEAEQGVARLGPELERNYRAFIRGVERYMADHPGVRPPWAPELRVADLIGCTRAMGYIYALVDGPKECAAAGVRLQDGLDRIVKGILPGASNGWVLAPSRTADRATMLLADPHTELQNPSYYEFRMHAGDLHSAGFAFGPLLWQVHTRHVSWAMTTENPNMDMWDCYEVEVDPDNPLRFVYEGEWHEMETRDETFVVRGGETVNNTFEYTRHNGVLSPVVARDGNRAWVVSTSPMHDTGLLDREIYRMNHARSVAELRQAMAGLGMFPQNLVVGDSSGDIFYVRAGKAPKRPPGYDWTRPVPGDSSATAWQGYHPFEDLVQVLDPPQGYIQNNNVAPDRLFAEDNLDPADYPSEVFGDPSGRITSRGLRSIELLSAAQDYTVEDALAHAFDERWITTEWWQWALRVCLDGWPHLLESRPEQTRRFVDRLLAFDGFASADSVAALTFHYWRRGMWEVFSSPEFEHLRQHPWPDSAFTEAFGEALVDRAERAADEMAAEIGSVDVAMGEVFRVGRGERSWPLGGESIDITEIPGCLADLSPLCERTMRAFASGPPDDGGQRRAYRGSHSMRLVVFTDPIQSYSLHVYGQSDDPASPHYDDQAALLSERRFKPTYFELGELEGHISSTLVLEVPELE
jgi:acyl-homoserine lactone acylase PvdQ